MTNEKMNDMTAAEEEVAKVDFSEEAIAALRESIDSLSKKEAILTKKLAKARAAGLKLQSEKCRELLQKVVFMKQEKKDQLKVAEAMALAAELDTFAEGMENDLCYEYAKLDEFDTKPIEEYRKKARRQKIVARILTVVSLVACIGGAITYLLLAMPEILNLPFNWLYLVVDAALLVVLLHVAAGFREASKNNTYYAECLEEERQKAIDAYNERMRQEMMSLANLEAVSNAYKLEGLGADGIADDEAKLDAEGRVAEIEIEAVPAKVKNYAKVIIPVVGVCAALIAIGAYSKKKRIAKKRKQLYKWL